MHGVTSLATVASVIALSLIAPLAGCRKAPAAAEVPPRAVRAVLARDEPGRAPTPYAGSLEPKVRVDLAFGVAGRVSMIGERKDKTPLREGDVVTRGQLLARLDDRDLSLQAASAVFAASSASADVAAAASATEQAEADLARVKALVDSGALPRTELEKAETARTTARAKLDAIREQRGAKLEQAALARRIESDARMLSPIDGVIARRMIDAGENVAPSTIAFTVIDPGEMKLVFAVPDVRIASVELGQLVPVRTEALPGLPLVGRVDVIHPVADPALRTFNVELTIDNGEGKLRSGMVASAALAGGDNPGGVLVPLASVVRAPDGALALFAIDGSRAEQRSVTLGDLVGNDVQVESGVRAGDRVITDGAPFLHDGETVEVVP